MKRLTALSLLCVTTYAMAADPAFPTFKVQEIDNTLKVGYGLRIIDLNGDEKLDIVVADAARVIWFDHAQDWKLRTIIENAKAGVKADNVCLDVADIDNDGKLDIALGADWQPNDTKDGGSLQWLKQGNTIDEWTVHPIAASIPTLHRIRFHDIDRDRKPELLVTPLKGKGSTPEKKFLDVPALLYAFSPPNSAQDPWPEPRVLSDSLHILHNIRIDPIGRILTASEEGIGNVFITAKESKWQSAVDAYSGQRAGPAASEAAIGMRAPRAWYFIAAIEPFHGHMVTAYTQTPKRSGRPLIRKVVDDQLKGGHALWCADLDGDELDEIIAGFREPTDAGVGPGINLYKGTPADDLNLTWTKHVLDNKGIACEDLACADLNNDGKIDIVACGRATGNVRIYWNQGKEKS